MKLDNVRILEGNNLLWDDITNAYKNKVDRDDYVLMHGMDNEVIKRLLSTKPFFSEYYIIELHLSKVDSKTLNNLMRLVKSEWIVVVLVLSKKEDYDMASTVIRKGFNGYKISYQYWLSYVRRRFNGETTCNLETVYKMITGRFELTDVLIDVLNKTDGNVKLATVTKLLGKREGMSIDMVWFNILRIDEKGRKGVFKYLEEYRYGYQYVYNTLKDKYNTMLAFYDDFYVGKLNEYNIREYKKETHLSEWILKSYIEIFNKVSYDEILLIGEIIECNKVTSTIKMFELVGRLYARRSL